MTKSVDNTKDGELGILERRTIEAEIIAPIYEEMVAAFGEDAAVGIVDRAIRKAAISSAQSFASREKSGTSLRSFAELQSLWTKDDALVVDILNSTETKFDYDVHRCRYAETYKAMGLAKIGHLLSCNRDAVFCQGYDPRIRLQRTQTIMEGASHCDFRYSMESFPQAERTASSE
ncbi:L-2-amino-thiazoline-4-carboxylic acid hydrolase [Rhizobium grahamii]|uniref:2-amino-thiazoline-4-carboxylic acid hydrolase n=1 Tax=Rhizobium grahamii TaxID=1120045 RepID=A0A370KPJ9_9HYPH|nr:L-2-amino-thiazoline-4-carboxylic acid hydrolase [Rhizobium grahamii]RDJ11247.1 2-amino-thiazoline-4-carboxylic acid hydrolase [Rhizobium grahamii]